MELGEFELISQFGSVPSLRRLGILERSRAGVGPRDAVRVREDLVEGDAARFWSPSYVK